jgi:PAP2 superfamily
MRALLGAFRVDTRPGASERQSAWPQLLLAIGAIALYEVAHLLTGDHRGAALKHAREVLGFERFFGIDWEHAVQGFTLHNEVLRTWGNGLYTWMYWPVIIGALVFTWHFDRRHYAILRDGMILSGGLGLLVFIFYPVAPPRMLPQFTDTIAVGSLEHSVVHGAIADSYAALPSFHVGWVALGAVVLALSASRAMATPGRSLALVLAAAATAIMTAAVVVTANHFVVDALSGIGLCLVCGAIAYRLHPVPSSTSPLPDALGQPHG